ncbi:DNA replication complex GINS family protein [Candidatus Bathyarchaeota archaeon]|nr:DNA replication complex GINS family protein [Candidatus Bathyarchaeota archaeon]
MSSLSIVDAKLDMDLSPVKVKILRGLPELFFSDEKLGPLREGDELELPYWAAQELADSGVAKILGREPLDIPTLTKVHWRECIPSSREIPQIDNDFYCRLRHLLRRLREEAESEPSKRETLVKVESQFKDIVDCRMRKIMYLATAPPQVDAVLQKMTVEERMLYSRLSTITREWRMEVLALEGEK